jgi:hypothetical protein
MPNITEAQAQALREAREIYSERDRKRRKAAIFADIKSSLKLSSSQKIKVEIDNRNSAHYCALKDGNTGVLLYPVMPAHYGPRVIEKLAAPVYEAVELVKPVAKKDSWPYPGGEAAQAGTAAKAVEAKPAMAFDRVASADHRYGNTQQQDASVPQLKLGSLALEDVLKLLRAEADASGSYASATGYADAAVFVKNDRLFFVL